MILATDMSRHFEDVEKFKTKYKHKMDWNQGNNRVQFLELMMHASDISNPCRPWE